MQVKFPTGTLTFSLENVYRYQEYPGSDNRWSERAFLFRDGSILWEMMGFTCYAADGSPFCTGGLVQNNGGLNLPGRINGDYPTGMQDLVERIKIHGKYLLIGEVELWELSNNS
jgi:hypothetical protein